MVFGQVYEEHSINELWGSGAIPRVIESSCHVCGGNGILIDVRAIPFNFSPTTSSQLLPHYLLFLPGMFLLPRGSLEDSALMFDFAAG